MKAGASAEWLGDFFAQTRRDWVYGILRARREWSRIDATALALARVAATPAIADETTPEAAVFAQLLEELAAHGGDPPVGPDLLRESVVIFNATAPSEALIDLAVAQGPASLASFGRMIVAARSGGAADSPFVRALARSIAAAALPRETLASVAPPPDARPAPDPLGNARALHERLMYEAQTQRDLDPARAEALVIGALEAARETPEPNDDVRALLRAMILASRTSLSDASLRRCVDAVAGLVAGGFFFAPIPALVADLTGMVSARGLAKDLGARLTDITKQLFEQPNLPLADATTLAFQLMSGLLGQGRVDEALDMLARLDAKPGLDAAGRLHVATLRAMILVQSDDRERAVAILVGTLEATPDAAPGDVLQALCDVVTSWRSRAPGVDRFAERAIALADSLGEVEGWKTRLRLVAALGLHWPEDRVRELAEGVDVGRLCDHYAATLPPEDARLAIRDRARSRRHTRPDEDHAAEPPLGR